MRSPRYIISRVNSLRRLGDIYRRYILYYIRFSPPSRSVFFGHLYHRADSFAISS